MKYECCENVTSRRYILGRRPNLDNKGMLSLKGPARWIPRFDLICREITLQWFSLFKAKMSLNARLYGAHSLRAANDFQLPSMVCKCRKMRRTRGTKVSQNLPTLLSLAFNRSYSQSKYQTSRLTLLTPVSLTLGEQCTSKTPDSVILPFTPSHNQDK